MKSRLQKLMASESLTSAKLAEIAGVQPSAVSHILSGRNYPSFEFISNILKAFPAINTRWLMLGEGEMYESSKRLQEVSHSKIMDVPNDQDAKPRMSPEQEVAHHDNNASNINIPKQGIKTQQLTPQPLEAQKNVDQIVIFYTDGTFSQFRNK